jgi:hypothetical protein
MNAVTQHQTHLPVLCAVLVVRMVVHNPLVNLDDSRAPTEAGDGHDRKSSIPT